MDKNERQNAWYIFKLLGTLAHDLTERGLKGEPVRGAQTIRVKDWRGLTEVNIRREGVTFFKEGAGEEDEGLSLDVQRDECPQEIADLCALIWLQVAPQAQEAKQVWKAILPSKPWVL